MGEKKKRIGSLDFIKFIAAILIIFHHFQGDFFYEGRRFAFSGGTFYFGYIVELFFIISGILIGMNNLNNNELTFGQFMNKRLLRLFPMTTYSTVVFVILVFVYKFFFDVWYCCEPLSPIALVRGIFLIYCGGPLAYKNVEPNCVLWYVCVLIICFGVYKLNLIIAKKLKFPVRYFFIGMIFLGVAIISYSINLPFLNFYTARGYLSFFLGVELVDLYQNLKNKKTIPIVSAIILLIIIAYSVIDSDLCFGNGLDQEMTLTFLLYPAIIGLLACTKINDLFRSNFFKTLGSVSFEMYICQYHVFLAIHLLEAFEVIKFPRSDKGMLLATLIIFIVSLLVHFFVEKPINSYLSKKIKKSEI